MQRASHALSHDGGVWLVDPVDGDGLEELLAPLGEVRGVLQLLDRHARDGAALARRHGVPLLETPFDRVAGHAVRAGRGEAAAALERDRPLVAGARRPGRGRGPRDGAVLPGAGRSARRAPAAAAHPSQAPGGLRAAPPPAGPRPPAGGRRGRRAGPARRGGQPPGDPALARGAPRRAAARLRAPRRASDHGGRNRVGLRRQPRLGRRNRPGGGGRRERRWRRLGARQGRRAIGTRIGTGHVQPVPGPRMPKQPRLREGGRPPRCARAATRRARPTARPRAAATPVAARCRAC